MGILPTPKKTKLPTATISVPKWGSCHTWYSLWRKFISQNQNGWSLREWVWKNWSGVINATFPTSTRLLRFLVTAAPPEITVQEEIYEEPLFTIFLYIPPHQLFRWIRSIFRLWIARITNNGPSCFLAVLQSLELWLRLKPQWHKQHKWLDSIHMLMYLASPDQSYLMETARASPMALWPCMGTATDLQLSWHVCLQAGSRDGAFNILELRNSGRTIWLMDLRDTISFPI